MAKNKHLISDHYWNTDEEFVAVSKEFTGKGGKYCFEIAMHTSGAPTEVTVVKWTSDESDTTYEKGTLSQVPECIMEAATAAMNEEL